MLKKNVIRLGLVAVLLAGCLLVFHSSARVKEGSCSNKECLDQCPKKRINSPAPGGMIWETLSRQFISFTSCSY